ncbi:MAG: outer membrane beta-barrel protein [Gammaproteobacteria bacterium]|nr:outer membrane beta-barrel protein [Gammaproteobacteria bacterium]
MKSHIFKRTFSTLALAGFAIPAAAADPSHWYFGAGLGESQADIAEEEIRADLLSSGFTTSGFADEESDFGYKLFAGYQFNRYLAVEGGYLRSWRVRLHGDHGTGRHLFRRARVPGFQCRPGWHDAVLRTRGGIRPHWCSSR